MYKKAKRRNGLREIPDDLWYLIKPLLPPDKPPGANGRPRVCPIVRSSTASCMCCVPDVNGKWCPASTVPEAHVIFVFKPGFGRASSNKSGVCA